MTLASILVVDDDAATRKLIAGGLRKLGHDVSESDCAGASLVGVPGTQPDLMILVRKPNDLPDDSITDQSVHNSDQVISAGGITVDNVGHRVAINDEFVSLAPQEYRLLLFLLTHQDRVFSRDQLLVHVWGPAATVGRRTVDVHVRRLRSVLELFDCDKYVQTVRGTGYRFSLNI